MERSRSKRNYYYDNPDYDNDSTGRTKPRYNNHQYSPAAAAANSHHNNNGSRHSRPNNPNVNNRQSSSKTQQQDTSLMVTTTYRILCHDLKAGGVIGKSGSIIKSIRQHTGAWINVHELIPGDEERIIEISDTRRRDPEGRIPPFSPAQEALSLIHERILESDAEFGGVGGGYGNDEEEYGGGRGGGGGGGGNTRVATRLVVSRMHVGCLLGKGGKIIEQMRMETKTQIRVLPRDHTLPRCVSMSEEIVQVLGDANNVKSAIAIISSRLRESQHRDRSNFQGRIHSPESAFPDDDYVSHMNNAARRSSCDGHTFGPRSSGTNHRSNNYSSRISGYGLESGSASCSELVFRLLCPMGKINRVVGETDGILQLLENEIGVDVKFSDPVSGSDEQIITISSEEGPDDELFPAQEALLHIQTRIVDLVPDQDSVIKTRLLVPNSEVGCLEGRESLSEMERVTGAKVQILAKEKLPACASGVDELVQIEGEIKSAREALVEVTSRLRSYLYRDFFQKDTPPVSTHGSIGRGLPAEAASSNNVTPGESYSPAEPSAASYQTAQQASTPPFSKDSGGSVSETARQNESERREDVPASTNRIPVTLVTRSILEVVIPEYAVPKLVAKSKNKLTQISELSGANVTLLEDSPDGTEKIIRISGTPEQAERAQSLLQGFILSTQEDGP